jgi:hypothetical protein
MQECSAPDAAGRLRSSLNVLSEALVALDAAALVDAEAGLSDALTHAAHVRRVDPAEAGDVRREVAAARALLARCRALGTITEASVLGGYDRAGDGVAGHAIRGSDLNTRL